MFHMFVLSVLLWYRVEMEHEVNKPMFPSFKIFRNNKSCRLNSRTLSQAWRGFVVGEKVDICVRVVNTAAKFTM